MSKKENIKTVILLKNLKTLVDTTTFNVKEIENFNIKYVSVIDSVGKRTLKDGTIRKSVPSLILGYIEKFPFSTSYGLAKKILASKDKENLDIIAKGFKVGNFKTLASGKVEKEKKVYIAGRIDKVLGGYYLKVNVIRDVFFGIAPITVNNEGRNPTYALNYLKA